MYEKANNPLTPESYHTVLIVFTKPFADFKDALLEMIGSNLYPISFLFVGLGNKDYSEYEILNTDFADSRTLSKFIHLKEPKAEEAKQIAKELLRDVPGHITELMDLMARQGGIQEEEDQN